jgi:hypothetical protein
MLRLEDQKILVEDYDTESVLFYGKRDGLLHGYPKMTRTRDVQDVSVINGELVVSVL